MNKQATINIHTIGFAIFTMLFGAGNILYSIKNGVLSGNHYIFGTFGFLLTAVLLPILGIVAMSLFEGNYTNFFNRIGHIPGFLAISFCMIIIGPLIIMPRSITILFEMLTPFLPEIINLPIFSTFFCSLIFLCAYKESGLLQLLGKYIFPILISSLTLVITLGLVSPHDTIIQNCSASSVFLTQLSFGFQTLDLLSALFFAFIIVKLIKSNTIHAQLSHKQLALLCLKGSIITALLMVVFYTGFILLGAHYADLVETNMNGAQMFRIIAHHIIGKHGILLVAIMLSISGLAGLAALAAVFAEYLQNEICNKKVSYAQSLFIGLTITLIISTLGLTKILALGLPIAKAGYPIIVTITACNIAYKLFNFQWIKLPVFIVTMVMLGLNIQHYLMV